MTVSVWDEISTLAINGAARPIIGISERARAQMAAETTRGMKISKSKQTVMPKKWPQQNTK
jgi:hypothetical protein